MNTKNLNQKAKIELIRKIQSGEYNPINGELFNGILISKDGVYYYNGKPVKPDDTQKINCMFEFRKIVPSFFAAFNILFKPVGKPNGIHYERHLLIRSFALSAS
jgi:hypothetical protein